jgi:hypothetical protein
MPRRQGVKPRSRSIVVRICGGVLSSRKCLASKGAAIVGGVSVGRRSSGCNRDEILKRIVGSPIFLENDHHMLDLWRWHGNTHLVQELLYDVHEPDCCPTGPPATPGWSTRSHAKRKIGSAQCPRPTLNHTQKLGTPLFPRSLRKGWEARMAGGPHWLMTIRAHVCFTIGSSSSYVPRRARISPRSQVSQRGRFHDHIWPLRLTDND